MSPHDVVEKLAGRVKRPPERGGISTGLSASLRRMDPSHPGSAALAAYQLLSDCGLDLRQSDEQLSRWLLLIHLLALMRGGHAKNEYIGAALVKAGFTDNRVKQLLGADFDVLVELLPRVVRRWEREGVSVDFHLLRDWLFADSPRKLNQARLRVAQSYVIATAKQQRNAS